MIRGYLDRAGEAMRLNDSAVRRALLLWNPGARDHWDTTNTLTAAVQTMMPGETVTTHRHIHSAMRFITHGKGATTTVNEHANASPLEPAILFSITDAPAFEALALLREEAYAANGGRQHEI